MPPKRKQVLKQLGSLVGREAVRKVGEFTRDIVHGRMEYPPPTRAFLNGNSQKTITALTITRNPIGNGTGPVIKLIGGKTPYDHLFHLAVEGVLEDGTRFVLEKNEVISIRAGSVPQKPHGDRLAVPMSGRRRLDEALEATLERMGKRAYFGYHPMTNNCQDYISAFLVSNNLGTPEILTFVKQETDSIFAKRPWLRKLAVTATDIAGRVDVLRHGHGMKDDALYGGCLTCVCRRSKRKH